MPMSMYEKNDLLLQAVRFDHYVTAEKMIKEGATNLFKAYGLSCIRQSRRCEEIIRNELIARGKLCQSSTNTV